MAPQDVGLAVGVEVAGILEMPGGVGQRDAQIVDELTVAHQPFGDKSVVVPPQHVADGIAVEVSADTSADIDHRRVVRALMVTVTSCAVPSAVSTVNVSVSVADPFSACTAAWLSSSV